MINDDAVINNDDAVIENDDADIDYDDNADVNDDSMEESIITANNFSNDYFIDVDEQSKSSHFSAIDFLPAGCCS